MIVDQPPTTLPFFLLLRGIKCYFWQPFHDFRMPNGNLQKGAFGLLFLCQKLFFILLIYLFSYLFIIYLRLYCIWM